MDVPWRIEHDYIAFVQDGEIELTKVAVDPLFRSVLDFIDQDFAHSGVLLLVVIDLVVDVLAVLHVTTRVQIRTVAQRFVRMRIDDLLEVHILARWGIWPHSQVRLAGFLRATLAKLAVKVVVLLELQ